MKPSEVVYTCNPSTQENEAGGGLCLRPALMARLGYKAKSTLKNKETNKHSPQKQTGVEKRRRGQGGQQVV